MTISKPQDSEFAPFYAGYIDKVSTLGPVGLLESQLDAFDLLRQVLADESNHRYAHDKWSVKEVVGHVADGERVFSYRLLRIARADQTPLACRPYTIAEGQRAAADALAASEDGARRKRPRRPKRAPDAVALSSP